MSIFDREKSVLSLFGYRTGAGAPLPSDRRAILRKVLRADLQNVLDPDDFEESGASAWATPNSGHRVLAMKACIAGPIRQWEENPGERNMEEALRHRKQDLAFAEGELSNEADWSDFSVM